MNISTNNREAYRMLNELIDYFAENEGVTEELKKENQMEWVRRMNNIKSTSRRNCFRRGSYILHGKNNEL